VDEKFGGSAKNKIARAAASGLAVPVIPRRSEFGSVGEIALRVKTGSAHRWKTADPRGKEKTA